MSLRLRFAALAVLGLAAGCPTDDIGLPDGGGSTQLRVEWTGQPATLPSPLTNAITLERAVFYPQDLRVVGDAGPISFDRRSLEWARDVSPTADVVPGAPPGLYSRLLFDLEGGKTDTPYAYELTGTARVGTTTRPFTIRDPGDLEISIELSTMLRAGETARIPIRADLDKLVEVVDFALADVEDGQFLVEDGVQLAAVRDKLREAFAVHGEP